MFRVCVSVALVIQHEQRLDRNILLCVCVCGGGGGPVRLYYIFPHYFIKKHNIRKSVLKIYIYFLNVATNLSETFLILRIIHRVITDVHRSSCKVLLFLSDFNKLAFFRQIFEKYSNIKLHENPSSGIRGVPCGRTDRYTDGETWQSRQSIFKILGMGLDNLMQDHSLHWQTRFSPSNTKRRPLYLKTQCVPRCKHFSSRL